MAGCTASSTSSTAAASSRCLPVTTRRIGRRRAVSCCAEKREYYDYKDMPPLPLNVARITVPELGYTVVDKQCEFRRLASLAIFADLGADDQYGSRLTRKSAMTALCMYDRDDVTAAEREPGAFPNIDLLQRVYSEGMEVAFVVEEL
jgi:hypothetical protein